MGIIIPGDNYGILTIKGEIVRSSYINIVSHRIEQKKFISLNRKLEGHCLVA